MAMPEKKNQSEESELSREFERQAEIFGLRDELAAMLPPRCEACGQVLEVKK